LDLAAYVTWGIATVLALVAGWIDLRSHLLPNWLTVSGFAVGVLTNAILGGWAGAKTSLLGAGIALAILLPVVLLRGLGAGDWKLMGALGAIVGREEIIYILFFAIVVAGLIAVAQMIRQKRVAVTLLNLWELMRGFFLFGLKPHPEINLENPAASTLPFGVAVAAATLLCCGAVLAGV
jgi:prepilin peptidase CpaA